MNIGIDCIALPLSFSGAANYILNLTRNLLDIERSFNIQIFCKTTHAHLFRKYLQKGDSLTEINISNRLQQLLYYESFLSKELVLQNTNIFLATHYIAPPQNPKYKIITIFHDIGFILHKEYYPVLKRKYFQHMIPKFIKRSEKIITVSQSTMKDLNYIFPDSLSKTIFIYPGTDHLQNFKTSTLNNLIKKDPFVLAVNSFEKRKNIPFIIDVFNILKQKYNINHNLFIVGRPNNGIAELKLKIKNSVNKEAIFLLQDISFGELKDLYKKASLFINASNYEGFGFTPIEAISQDCPVFLNQNNVCKELFNNHPCIINSKDPYKWAETIYAEMRNNYINKISYGRLAELSWEKCAFNFKNLFNSMSGIANAQRSHINNNKPYSKLWQRS